MHRSALVAALLVATALAAPVAPSGSWAWNGTGLGSVVDNVLSLHQGSVYVTGARSIAVLDQSTGAKLQSITAPADVAFTGQMSFASDADASFAIPCTAGAAAGVAFYGAAGALRWRTAFADNVAAFPEFKDVDCSTRAFSFAGGNVIGECFKPFAPGSGCMNVTLFALSQTTGKVVWAKAVGQPPLPMTAPAVDAGTGTVVTAARVSVDLNKPLTVTAFSADTGAVRWSVKPAYFLDSLFSALSICGGNLVVYGLGNTYALSISSGLRVWGPLPTPPIFTTTPRCVAPTTSMANPEPSLVFVSSATLHVSRIGAQSGTMLFSTQIPGKGTNMKFSTENIAVDAANDRVLALFGTPNPDGQGGFMKDILTVVSLRLSTGATTRTTPVPDVLQSSVTSGIAARPSPTSAATMLYFADAKERSDPVVFCRAFW